MRLPGFLALFTAVNLPLRVYGVPNALLLSLGTGVGYFLWGAFFTTVAWYGRDVPEPICVRSLNKLRRLAVAVLLLLAVIGFAPFTFSNL
jgi:membrane protein DedA with SNARE-associated domain